MQTFSDLNWLYSLIVLLLFVGVFCYWLHHWTTQKPDLLESAKVLDAPERWSGPKPNFGGVLFFIAFCISLLLGLSNQSNDVFNWLFMSATSAFALGMWDDLKRINPTKKFIGQFLAAGLMVAGGYRIGMFAEPIGLVVSFLFVVALMNAINMLDNMDAVATIVALGVFAFGVVVNFVGYYDPSPYAVLLVAACLSFLLYNWNPSKIFMGDSGTMLLGVLMAGVFMHHGVTNSSWVPGWLIDLSHDHMMDAIMMLALPIVDTAVVITNRVRHGVSPFKGGKDHTTHNLVYLGLKDRGVALVFVILTIFQFSFTLFSNYLLSKKASVYGYAVRDEMDYFIIVYILMLFFTMLLISFRNLRRGKYSYPKK